MNAEEMRIAIANRLGWVQIHRAAVMGDGFQIWKAYPPTLTEKGGLEFLPNYPADLNAMHEAEKALNEDQRDEYWCLLRHSVSAGLDDMQHCFNTTHATAAQRAEAFCRVFWPERFKE